MKIFRPLFGAVLGYLTTALTVMVGMTVAAMTLGADRVFVGTTWQSSDLWNTLAIVLGAIAAFLGGIVATWWGGSKRAGRLLAAIIIALGIVASAATVGQSVMKDPPARPAVMTFADWGNSSKYSRQPVWFTVAMPIVGAVGVVLGMRFIARKKGIN